MNPKALFVAATGQNVGKTTTCLGLMRGLKKRVRSVGFIKPVGQEYIETTSGISVDKDVVLFKTHFDLPDPYEVMSPVLLPQKFTRDYLDGKIPLESMHKKIISSFSSLADNHEIIILEGTGHTGVGSIIDLNNAQVAALLGCPILLVASGGLGSSFDELSLNYAQCEKYRVPIAGVVLNRVFENKKAMIQEYMGKALKRWNVPLLGCIPYNAFLSTPTMFDFEQLFQTKLLTAEAQRLRHFHHIRLATSSPEIYRQVAAIPNELIITSASREEIVLTALTHYWDAKIQDPQNDFHIGLILTGRSPPKATLVNQIERANIPMLHVPLSSFIVMKMINTHTTKIRQGDVPKIEEAIKIVEQNIDFDKIVSCLNLSR